MNLPFFTVIESFKRERDHLKSFPCDKIQKIFFDSEIFLIDLAGFSDGKTKLLEEDDFDFEKIPALPFKTVTFNFAIRDDIAGIFHESYTDPVSIYSLTVDEQSPGVYFYIIFTADTESFRGPHEDLSNRKFLYGESLKDHANIYKLLHILIEYINSSDTKIGIEKYKKYISFPKKIGKKKISQIIHIQPKYSMESWPSQPGRKIEWSHLWAVRGHWRKHKGIGKDREGIYQIPGYTFVREHIKGIGEEVVKKIRIKKSRIGNG